MGTFYTVEVLEVDAQLSRRLKREIEGLLDVYNQQLSNWREDSWITSFNESESTEWKDIPNYASRALTVAMDLAERTRGALDPTLAPVIELWGFGVRRGGAIPSESEIERVMETVGYHWIELDLVNGRVKKKRPNVSLNLSSVAKGLAVDMVAESLRSEGLSSFLINIGGDLRASGVDANGQPWKVSADAPWTRDGSRAPIRVFSIVNQAVATSGHDQRSFEHEGRRYSHIIDSRTGWPVVRNERSATVIAPTCALADGLATVALVLGADEMEALVAEYEGVSVEYGIEKTPRRRQGARR